jgi:hypothetical protein
MAYHLQYFDEVETDVHQAKVWYKEQKEGLETEFVNLIEKTIEHILDTPKAYAIRYKKYVLPILKYFLTLSIFILMSLIKLL